MPRPRILIAAIATALTVTGLALGANAAHAGEITARSGTVAATFSYQHPTRYTYTHLRLTVTRAGQVAYDAAVRVGGCSAPYCIPWGTVAGNTGLTVRDLDGSGEPEVVADVFTGGAHCCEASEILRLTPAGYRASQHNWGDPGYRLAVVGGIPEFLTGDERFAYAFTDYADSRWPVRVYRYHRGALSDITGGRSSRPRVRSDARALLHAYRRRRAGLYARGAIAAWAADEYTLGHARRARAYLDREARAGRLRTALPDIWPTPRRFIAQLEQDLRRWGY